MSTNLEQPLQTFEINIRLQTQNHCIAPCELPHLIMSALDGDGCSCLFHACSWTPMVRGQKYTLDDEPECGICLETIKNNQLVGKSHCGHLFHKTCLQNWFRKSEMLFASTCPNCRARMPVEYKFNRAAEVLSKPKVDNKGEVYYERMLVPQQGKHHNKLIYTTKV